MPEYRQLVEAFESDRSEVMVAAPYRLERSERWAMVLGERAQRANGRSGDDDRSEPHRPGGHDRSAEPGLRGADHRPRTRDGARCCARGSVSRGCWPPVAAAGRVVVPILIQQAIDKGVDEETGDVQFDLIVKMALIGAVAVMVSGFALRQASIRLGERSERALYDLRARLIGHIHQLSLATHNDERRGGLVSRVTSDIEALAQFFQWGGLAWLLDGTLMLIVAGRDARLQLAARVDRVRRVDAAGVRSAGRAIATRARLRRRPRTPTATCSAPSPKWCRARRPSGRTAPAEVLEQRVHDGGRGEDGAHRSRRRCIGAFLFPSGEIFSAFTISAIVGSACGWARRAA